MKSTGSHSRQEGQVLPALLLAVLCAGVLTGLLFIVGRAGDQSTRAGTAADAAALAAGKEASQELQDYITANPLSIGGLGSGAGLQLAGIGARASSYARANGSEATDVQFLGFDGGFAWRFAVTVKPKDTVSDDHHGGVSRSEVTSTVSVHIGGLCNNGGAGFVIYGGCLTTSLFRQLCAPPPPPAPSPAPVPSGSPTPTPDPVPTREPLPGWLDGHGCPGAGQLRALLSPDIRLVS